MIWRDITSFSRDEKDRTPRTFQADVLGTRLIVTRHIDYPGKWCVVSHGDVSMTITPLVAESADGAKLAARNRMIRMIEAYARALGTA